MIYLTKRGKMTTRKTNREVPVASIGNEQYVRDGRSKPDVWGVQHMKTHKLKKVCATREEARMSNLPGRTRVVAICLNMRNGADE